ncbi:MAG: hypothetical protein RL240_1841 [Planctomycetota bacterium]
MNRLATFCLLCFLLMAVDVNGQEFRRVRTTSPSSRATVPARVTGTPKPAAPPANRSQSQSLRARPASARSFQEPIREAVEAEVYESDAYDDGSMQYGDEVVLGGDGSDGEYVIGDYPEASHGEVYYDDEPMMYDANGFETVYGGHAGHSRGCASCGEPSCSSCGIGNPFGVDLCHPGGDLPGRQLCICLPSHGWVSVDYLGLFASGMNMPALVSTSPAGTSQALAGVLPGANVLYGGNDEAFTDSISGIRVRVGLWSAVRPDFGAEGEYFGFAEQAESFEQSSTGTPILARPFYNNITGLQDAELVAFPGLVSGKVRVDATSRLDAAAVRFRHILCCSTKESCSPWDCGPIPAQSRIDATLGWRFMQLDESLSVTEDLTSLSPNNPGSFLIEDNFRTFNQFNGMELGFQWIGRRGFWTLDSLMRVSVGINRQWLEIQGSTRIPRDATPMNGGLLAQQGRNIGVVDRNEFGVVPEFGTTLGYQLTERLKLNVGYTGIFWASVLRPGDQIDTTVNTNLLPPAIPTNSYLGPGFTVRETNYWVQGLTAGIEYRW